MVARQERLLPSKTRASPSFLSALASVSCALPFSLRRYRRSYRCCRPSIGRRVFREVSLKVQAQLGLGLTFHSLSYKDIILIFAFVFFFWASFFVVNVVKSINKNLVSSLLPPSGITTMQATISPGGTHQRRDEAGVLAQEALSSKPKFDPSFTPAVIDAIGPRATPRVRQVMSSLIQHVHDFARDNEITVDEWMAAVGLVSLRAFVLTPGI